LNDIFSQIGADLSADRRRSYKFRYFSEICGLISVNLREIYLKGYEKVFNKGIHLYHNLTTSSIMGN